MAQTVDGVQGGLLVARVQIPKGLAHHQTEFHLIVQVGAAGAQHGAFAGTEDGGGRLEEEEGLLRFSVVQLGDVVAARCVRTCDGN